MRGVLNLLKPPGMTSHDGVAFVRRVLGEKRVGHTGTLDPAAAGVLPICVGQATRLVEYLQAGTKEYVAEGWFGVETDSGDLLGETVAEGPTGHLTREQIEVVLPEFRGEIDQIPPMHSAIKVDGERLYDLARAGKTAVIPVRRVVISKLECRWFEAGTRPRALFDIECSGGTYIRSLIRDIGRAAGVPATMSFLVRTRSGGFTIDQAQTPEEFRSRPALTSFGEAVSGCAALKVVDDSAALALYQGKLTRCDGIEDFDPEGHSQLILIQDQAASLFALAARVPGEPGLFRAEKVFDLRADF